MLLNGREGRSYASKCGLIPFVLSVEEGELPLRREYNGGSPSSMKDFLTFVFGVECSCTMIRSAAYGKRAKALSRYINNSLGIGLEQIRLA